MQDVFRPKSNLVWAALAYTLLAIFLIQSVFYPGTNENAFVNVAFESGVGVLVFLIWIRPKIVFKDDVVIIVNPFSTSTIRYRDITRLSTQWTLAIESDSGVVKAWVAPTSTRRQGVSKTASKLKGVQASLDRPNISDSELAGRLIQERIDALH